nr:phage recombination protein Bet [Brucella intermedia]
MNQIVTAPKRSLVDSMAARYDMEPKAFVDAIKASVIKGDCSNEQFAAFLMVAKEYDLNPLTKEIYAFPDRGGIQPIVSIDGWMKLINSHPQFDGMEFDDNIDDGKLSSITCRMYRKDRNRAIIVTEYMVECSRNTDPWKKWPARMLRHKAAIQAARYAFGFSGIMEPDEYDRMKDVTPVQRQVIVDPLSDEPQATITHDGEIVHAETGTLASGSNNEEQDTPAEVASSGSVEGGERSVLSGSTLINSEEESAPVDDQPEQTETTPAAVELTVAEREGLKEYINQCRNSVGPDPSVIVSVAKGYADMFTSDLAKAKARTITERFIAVCKEEETGIRAVQYSCSIIGVEPAELDEVE